VDGIEPGSFREVFGKDLALAAPGIFRRKRRTANTAYTRRKTAGNVVSSTTYYHSALTGAIVQPGSHSVLPVMPEMITNEDGCSQANLEKQDCELNAGKRWLTNYGKEYA
jgi:hypothetical protein